MSSTLYQDNIYLYSWGRNKNGELGNGSMSDCFSPTAVKSLKDIQILQISSGGKHTLLLTKDHEIYSCGSGEFGVLGNYSDNKMKSHTIFEPIESFEDETIDNITCAEFHSLCVNRDGFVCSWGGNLYSKLGQNNPTGVPAIIKSLSVKKVIQISCGDHHTAALTNDNELYTWGGGGQYNHGQCGLGSFTVEVDTPTEVTFFKKKNKTPIKVCCGGYHTIVQCLDNSLYAFGKGNYGQCGYGAEEDTSIPKEVNFNKEDIKDISCGGEHSAILTEKGELFTFGHGYNGQLGHGDNFNCSTPRKVQSLSKVKVSQIACGWSHTMILTSLGYLYVTGCNVFGELGTGDKNGRENFVFLKEVSKLNINKIFCGGHHSWVSINAEKPIKDHFTMPQPLMIVNKDSDEQKELYKNKSASPLEYHHIEKKKKTIYSKIQKTMIKYDIDSLCIDESESETEPILKILYTSLPLSSRHIKFCISTSSNKYYKKFIETFSKYLENNPSIISHTLIESYSVLNDHSKERYKDLDGIYRDMSSPFTASNVPLGVKEYILILTCNKAKANEESSVKIMTLDDIQNDKTEKYLSEWVLDFIFLFKDIIMMDPSPSFIELR